MGDCRHRAAPAVARRVASVPVGDLGLPVLVVAELLFGPHLSKRFQENVARVLALEAGLPVLPVTRPIVGDTAWSAPAL